MFHRSADMQETKINAILFDSGNSVTSVVSAIVSHYSHLNYCVLYCMIICSAKNLLHYLPQVYSILIPWHHWQKFLGSPKKKEKKKKT